MLITNNPGGEQRGIRQRKMKVICALEEDAGFGLSDLDLTTWVLCDLGQVFYLVNGCTNGALF